MDFSIEVRSILSGQDVGHSSPTCDISPTHVLCPRVYETHSLRLVHQYACICSHLADSMQDREAEEFWLWEPYFFLFLREDTHPHPEVSLSPPPPREPQMMRWTQLWYRLGGEPSQHYDKDFFNWWAHLTFCVDEYCYAEMDYRGDPDLPLQVDSQWGDIGMISVFVFSHIYDFFL
jgi:hypothetical protein